MDEKEEEGMTEMNTTWQEATLQGLQVLSLSLSLSLFLSLSLSLFLSLSESLLPSIEFIW